MNTEVRLGQGHVDKIANKHETLILGALVTNTERLTLPWPYRLKYKKERELKMCDYYNDQHLMSKRLVDKLISLGVDNIQTFPAVITDSHTNEIIEDYLTVNVLGLVSCASMDESTSHPLADVNFFQKLVIDESRANGLLMFRLAESRIDLIVAEKIAEALMNDDFIDLKFVPLNGEDDGLEEPDGEDEADEDYYY